MATIGFGSGLQNTIAGTTFANYSIMDSTRTNLPNYVGMGGYSLSVWNYISGSGYHISSVTQYQSLFSLMKGTVPSAYTDINSGQRSSDELVRYLGQYDSSNASNLSVTQNFCVNGNNGITPGSDSSISPQASRMVGTGDFLISQSGAVVNWSPLAVAFSPRYPLHSGTPTWFWFRTAGNEHTIYGTVGASGSGSDLELGTYGNIDSNKLYTMYDATLMNFTIVNTISF